MLIVERIQETREAGGGRFESTAIVVPGQRMNCAMTEWIPEIDSEHLLGLETPLISNLMVAGRFRGGGTLKIRKSEDRRCF